MQLQSLCVSKIMGWGKLGSGKKTGLSKIANFTSEHLLKREVKTKLFWNKIYYSDRKYNIDNASKSKIFLLSYEIKQKYNFTKLLFAYYITLKFWWLKSEYI